MASMNRVFLMGNLCKDVEIRQVGSGTVGQLRLAVNEGFTSKSGEKTEKTVFLDVEAWDRLADSCAKMIGQGCSVMVEGRLQMDEWADRETGKKKTKIKVRADRIEFLTFRDRGTGDESETGQNKSIGVVDEDIPF